MKTFSNRTVKRLACVLCMAAICLPQGLRAGALTPVTVTIEEPQVPLAGGTMVLTPTSPGTDIYTGGGATVDVTNCAEGYVTVACRSASRIKVQVTKSGGTTYTYNLNNGGAYEVFPLTGGDGTYKIGVYENVTGDKYAEAVSANISVTLRSQALPFLYPNQYVNFSANSNAVAKGQALAQTAGSDLEIIANVYNFVIGSITYDTQKAQTIQQGGLQGYLPVVDEVLASGKGICFDYASLMAAMLRSQQIPTRVELGYVSNGAYHAWISTYIAEVGWINGIIQFDGKSWKLMDPTFASSGGASDSIMQYIGNGSNYRTQYLY